MFGILAPRRFTFTNTNGVLSFDPAQEDADYSLAIFDEDDRVVLSNTDLKRSEDSLSRINVRLTDLENWKTAYDFVHQHYIVMISARRFDSAGNSGYRHKKYRIYLNKKLIDEIERSLPEIIKFSAKPKIVRAPVAPYIEDSHLLLRFSTPMRRLLKIAAAMAFLIAAH